MSKQPPLAPTASAIGPCPTITPALEVSPGPSHHPTTPADHLALGCHGKVNLEPNISLFLALIDLIGIFLNLYVLLRCAFVESR